MEGRIGEGDGEPGVVGLRRHLEEGGAKVWPAQVAGGPINRLENRISGEDFAGEVAAELELERLEGFAGLECVEEPEVVLVALAAAQRLLRSDNLAGGADQGQSRDIGA